MLAEAHARTTNMQLLRHAEYATTGAPNEEMANRVLDAANGPFLTVETATMPRANSLNGSIVSVAA